MKSTVSDQINTIDPSLDYDYGYVPLVLEDHAILMINVSTLPKREIRIATINIHSSEFPEIAIAYLTTYEDIDILINVHDMSKFNPNATFNVMSLKDDIDLAEFAIMNDGTGSHHYCEFTIPDVSTMLEYL